MTKYKNVVKDLEKQVKDRSVKEEKLKKENDSYRRQILFYQEKLKLELANKKLTKSITSPKKKVRFTDSGTHTHTSSKTVFDLSTPEKSAVNLRTAYKNARKEKVIKSAYQIPKEVIGTPLAVWYTY
jgi:hypothetical protein